MLRNPSLAVFMAACSFVLMVTAPLHAAEQANGFVSIFNGKTLEGWHSTDMSHWSVEDGAITGRTTKENPLHENLFLVWQLGKVDDFELKLKYRITGSKSANSGIQYRGRVTSGGHVAGYQADISLNAKWSGDLYDEKGRGLLTQRGHKVVIHPDGSRTVTKIGDPQKLNSYINKGGWNTYHIIARGNRLVHKINGHVMSITIDKQKSKNDLSGVLAFQLHAGPPMTVQFKDIMLKRLPLSGDRKKVVFIADGPSHSFGEHDHRAGSILLAKRLERNMPNILTTIYPHGWPADPTAFDNADTIVIYADGGKRHPVMGHLKEMDELMEQGVGLVCLHYAVEVPKGKPGQYFLDWLGGYFEIWWSVNPHWIIHDPKLAQNHPITRGVEPFDIRDEWYYHMRFREHMKNVTPILSDVPPMSTLSRSYGPHSGNPAVHKAVKNNQPQILAWAYERPGGGRSFGFTGGHFHRNWAHDEFRQLVLNAIVWTAGAEVPKGGVQSKTPTIQELMKHHDQPKPEDFDKQALRRRLRKWN